MKAKAASETSNDKSRVAAALAGHDGFSLISDARLRAIYAAIEKARELGGSRVAGAEAVLASAAIHLHAGDACGPEKLASLAEEASGFHANGTSPKEQECDAAAEVSELVRGAIEQRGRQKGEVTVLFAGDGVASFKELEAAMRLAAVHRLPVVFFFMHGLSPRSRSASVSADKHLAKAAELKIPAMVVDGHDAVAVYRVATETVSHARKENGPSIVFCEAWPLEAGVGARDPLARMGLYLKRKGVAVV